ncbi:MAG: hypothetical protein ACU0A5_03855 [Salipiger marinus]|uniref:hypothetical protein n=1 Tax=Salipiger marinus TaxID=555512 RepID=UPI004059EB12
MNRDDSVSVAFDLMGQELAAAIEDLNGAGAEAFRQSRYAEATELGEKGRALAEFHARVAALAAEWTERFAAQDMVETAPEQVDAVARQITSASKAPKTGLRVRFPDGHEIERKTAALTLAHALQRIGFEKVAPLGLVVNREPLVSRSPSQRYDSVPMGRVFVRTSSSTAAKKRQLEQIARQLGLELQVEITAPPAR